MERIHNLLRFCHLRGVHFQWAIDRRYAHAELGIVARDLEFHRRQRWRGEWRQLGGLVHRGRRCCCCCGRCRRGSKRRGRRGKRLVRLGRERDDGERREPSRLARVERRELLVDRDHGSLSDILMIRSASRTITRGIADSGMGDGFLGRGVGGGGTWKKPANARWVAETSTDAHSASLT